MLDHESHAVVCLWFLLWIGCYSDASAQQDRSDTKIERDSPITSLADQSDGEQRYGHGSPVSFVDTVIQRTNPTTQPIVDTLSSPTDTIQGVKSPSGIDSIVTYSATDSIIYTLSEKKMYLFGRGDIKYKKLGLKAENIDVNWNTSILNAQGVPDTADTSGKGYRGLPDLVDGGETYHGSRISYNFRTKKGKINVGDPTELAQAHPACPIVVRPHPAENQFPSLA